MSLASKIAAVFAGGQQLDASIGGAPSGVVLPYAGTTAPNGWLMCYGQSLSTASYPALFAVIGYTYGGSGSNFNLPDLRGRVPAGKDNMGGAAANRLTAAGAGVTGTTLGATGGGETHTLTTAQMPAHAHGVSDPGHGHSIDVGATPSAGYGLVSAGTGFGYVNRVIVNGTGGLSSNGVGTGISVQNNGAGLAHPNVQPTIVLNHIIKT